MGIVLVGIIGSDVNESNLATLLVSVCVCLCLNSLTICEFSEPDIIWLDRNLNTVVH